MNEPVSSAAEDAPELTGPVDAPQDVRGCLTAVARCGGCMSILYIIMFLAIILAAGLSLLFFR